MSTKINSEKNGEAVSRIIKEFQDCNGKAFCRVKNRPLWERLFIEMFVKFRTKRPDANILIVASDYNMQQYFKTVLASQELDHNCTVLYGKLDDKKKMFQMKHTPLLTFCVDFEDIADIIWYCRMSKFIFHLSTGKYRDFSNDEKMELNRMMQEIRTKDSTDIIDSNLTIYSHGVNLNEHDRDLYGKYSETINDVLKIMGKVDKTSFVTLLSRGSRFSSRTRLALEFAEYNGWKRDLDLSIPINKEINRLYNPSRILELAENAYSSMQSRRLIMSDCPDKINVIWDLVKAKPDRKFLIVSKRGEFANAICAELNRRAEKEICGCCHSDMKPQTLRDEKGMYITYSTGINRGKPKLFGSLRLSRHNIERFGKGELRCLSTKNCASDLDPMTVDVMIVTTPLYESIPQILSRFDNMSFTGVKKEIHVLYCEGTTEEDRVSRMAASLKCNVVTDKEVYTDDTNLTIDFDYE